MATLIASYIPGNGSDGTSYYRKTEDISAVYHSGSYYLGCEGNNYRIIGYKFKVPATGIVNFSFSLIAKNYTTNYDSHTAALAGTRLRFSLSTDNSPPLPSSTSLGTITVTDEINFQSSMVKQVLKPDTEYYLWIYSSEYYQGYWEVSGKEVTITYLGGVIKIFVDSKYVYAIPWLYTNNKWNNAIPWVYSSGWKNTC